MINKRKIVILIILFIPIILLIRELSANNLNKLTLELQFPKNKDWSLTEKFLNDIKAFTYASIFVESGTYIGDTAYHASSCFDQVYSVELSPNLYAQAVNRFANNKKIFLYQGDTTVVFPRILKNIKGKIVFWLDGHFSGGSTARGEIDTPVMQELKAIKESGLNDSVILIDDIRLFDIANDYPSVLEVYEFIKTINSLYRIEIIGDILIAYLETELFDVSPIIKACTISRFGESLFSVNEVLEAEQVIAQAKYEEKVVLEKINTTVLQNRFSYLWCGMISMQECRYDEASINFKKALELGLNHWRIFWYLGLNAYKAKLYDQALKYLTFAHDQQPLFEDCSKMLAALANSDNPRQSRWIDERDPIKGGC
jgi:tetratricopeptide (TPR) repeat protein